MLSFCYIYPDVAHINIICLYAAITSTMDDSFFAVLGLIPKSSNESTLHDADGVILLFNVQDPVPVTTWFVRKVTRSLQGL